jgi:hypothetical protein
VRLLVSDAEAGAGSTTPPPSLLLLLAAMLPSLLLMAVLPLPPPLLLLQPLRCPLLREGSWCWLAAAAAASPAQ